MRKVCVVVASRSNYGRIKSVLAAIRDHPELQLQLVVGASALLHRFGKVIDLIQEDGFAVDARVYFIVEGENPTTMAKSTGLAVSELSTIFENLKPDVVLTVADRFEAIATAIAAAYMNIPLAHTQGGELTGNIDESVRHAITKFAHVHFPATDLSAKRVLRMGEDPRTVVVTGCPSIDVLANLDLSLPKDIFVRYGGVGSVQLDSSRPYLVALQHPVTTEFGKGMDQIGQTLQAVATLRTQTVWLWPNVDAGSDDVSKRLRMFRESENPDYIRFFRNFSVEDYARLIKNCLCLIGNSSSGIREGAYLGTPVVNIGTRQQFRERGANVIDVDCKCDEIVRAVEKQIGHGPFESTCLYGDGNASQRIVDVLATCEFKVQKRFYD